MATRALSPAKIMQLGVGFWGSKALLSAIELGLFTVLGGDRAMPKHYGCSWDCTRVVRGTSSMRSWPWACSNEPGCAMPILRRRPCF